MERFTDSENNRRLQYISTLYAPEDEILQEISRNLDSKRRSMQLSPVEARIVQVLLKAVNARKVLEIGTLVGYSAIWIARALPTNGQLISIEKSDQNYHDARNNIAMARLTDKVRLVQGDAQALLPGLADEAPFDAIFIDADKTSYPAYLEFAYGHLRPGGLVLADNTLLFDTVLEQIPPKKNPEMWYAIRKFNETLANREKFESIILPTNAGLTVALRVT